MAGMGGLTDASGGTRQKLSGGAFDLTDCRCGQLWKANKERRGFCKLSWIRDETELASQVGSWTKKLTFVMSSRNARRG